MGTMKFLSIQVTLSQISRKLTKAGGWVPVMDSEGSSLRITLKKIDVIARLYCAKDSSDFPGAFLPFFPDFSTA